MLASQMECRGFLRLEDDVYRVVGHAQLSDSSRSSVDKADFNFVSRPAQLRPVRSFDNDNDAYRLISPLQAYLAVVVFGQEDI